MEGRDMENVTVLGGMPYSDSAEQRLLTALVRMPYIEFRKWMDLSDEIVPLRHSPAALAETT